MAYKMAWKLLTGIITFNFSRGLQGSTCLYLHPVDEEAWSSREELSAKHLVNTHKAQSLIPAKQNTTAADKKKKTRFLEKHEHRHNNWRTEVFQI